MATANDDRNDLLLGRDPESGINNGGGQRRISTRSRASYDGNSSDLCCDRCTKQGVCSAVFTFLLLIAVIVLTVIVLHNKTDSSSDSKGPKPTADEIATCLANGRKWTPLKTKYDTPSSIPVLIQKANVYTGNDELLLDIDLLLQDGKIVTVGTTGTRLTPPAGSKVIDAAGRYVTPGLVEIHSHIGVAPWPGLEADNDVNELTSPFTTSVRAIDGFNPNDRAIPWIRDGGITTSQILPGSGNLMGGEGIMVKMKSRIDGTFTTMDDLVLANYPRYLKFASGENPKKAYGSKGQAPSSRMGSAQMMRDMFIKARALMTKQEAYCSRSRTGEPDDVFPDEFTLNPLVGLLTGTVRVHCHSYMVQDIQMLLRLSKEFGFKITAIHHAIEAWKIPDVIAAQNITIATWADAWGFKWEAYDSNPYGHKLLVDAGVNLAMHSDHPAIGTLGHFLMYEAAKAHHWGVPTMAAIASVTSTPARTMGIGDRIGSIRTGFDADVVVWDRHPLLIGARPNTVVIDGKVMVDNSYPSVAGNADPILPTLVESGSTPICAATSPQSLTCYAILNVTIYPMTPTIDTQVANGAIVVRDGTLQCVGSLSDCESFLASDCNQYSLSGTGGVVIPGMIESSGTIGTNDCGIDLAGNSRGSSDSSASLYNTMDDVQVTAKHVRMAWKSGVSTAIVAPGAVNLVRGRGVAIYTCCGDVVDDNLLASPIGVFGVIGGALGSTSADVFALRVLFEQARAANDTGHDGPFDSLRPIMDILAKRIPFVVAAGPADHLSALLRLQAEYGFRLVVMSQQATILRSRLASAGIPVVLVARTPPSEFDTRSYDADAVLKLTRAGVKVAIQLPNVDARLLRWEAGWMRASGLTTGEALATVTVNPADMFGLPSYAGRLVVGQPADFFVYNGDPLSLQSHIILGARGSYVQCNPK